MKSQNMWELVGFYHRAHPWHGVDIGSKAPEEIQCYIEIVPTDTVKFELDKNTGILKADRPQLYSNYCPALYGLVPRTHCGKRVGAYCGKKVGRNDIEGDDDPLDICVLTEKEFLRGDMLLTAIPIGGLRAIDGNEADDKIIAVLKDDLVYHAYSDISEFPPQLIDRLKHYFLTYKDMPGQSKKNKMEITHVYGKKEAHEVIKASCEDYDDLFAGMKEKLRVTLEA